MEIRDQSTLNDATRLVYALIKNCADDDEYLPTNREMADRLGFKSVSTPSQCITTLHELGFLNAECRDKSRRITIYDTGQVIFSKYWYRCPPPERLERWSAPNLGSSKFRNEAILAQRAIDRKARIDELRPPDRTPCRRCQVRHDMHIEHGCNAFMAAVAA